MDIKYIGKRVVLLFMIISLNLLVSGCSNFSSNSTKPSEAPPAEPKTQETTAVYYDFEDVLIPKELNVINDRTVVVSTPGFISGIITLRGRVERTSLFNFFNNNMQKDNWNIVSQIKSPGTTIMVFQKTSRCAVITIRDEQIYTYVEIGIAPTLGGSIPVDQGSSIGVSESTLSE